MAAGVVIRLGTTTPTDAKISITVWTQSLDGTSPNVAPRIADRMIRKRAVWYSCHAIKSGSVETGTRIDQTSDGYRRAKSVWSRATMPLNDGLMTIPSDATAQCTMGEREMSLIARWIARCKGVFAMPRANKTLTYRGRPICEAQCLLVFTNGRSTATAKPR